MKAFIFTVLSLFAVEAAQAACPALESQIIGTVIQSELKGNDCSTVVEIDRASPHVFCPLNLQVGQRVSMAVQKRGDRCPLSGEAISGVAQKIGENLRLDE